MLRNKADARRCSPMLTFRAWATCAAMLVNSQAPVVQTLDSAIHRIKIYLVDNAIDFPNTYPLDSDLSAG